MTFGTARERPVASKLRPMETIATITTYAAITCVLALIAIIWRHAERTDAAVDHQRRHTDLAHD